MFGVSPLPLLDQRPLVYLHDAFSTITFVTPNYRVTALPPTLLVEPEKMTPPINL